MAFVSAVRPGRPRSATVRHAEAPVAATQFLAAYEKPVVLLITWHCFTMTRCVEVHVLKRNWGS